jgi:hypothetical protein
LSTSTFPARVAACFLVGTLVAYGVGVVLSMGRSAQWPESLLDSRDGRWLLPRTTQPRLSIPWADASHAALPLDFSQSVGMEWERSPIHDTIVLRALTAHEWERWGRTEYPATASVLEEISALRANPPDPHQFGNTIDFARRNDDLLTRPPMWAGRLTGDPSEGVVESVAYGWPVRTVVCTGRLLVDPGDRQLVKATTSDGLGSFSNPFVAAPAWGIAWRPIWLPLIGSGTLFGSALLAMMLGARSLVYAFRVRRGRCLRCGYQLASAGPGACCPECGDGARDPEDRRQLARQRGRVSQVAGWQGRLRHAQVSLSEGACSER